MNFVVTQCVNDFGRRRRTQNATFALYETIFQRPKLTESNLKSEGGSLKIK